MTQSRRRFLQNATAATSGVAAASFAGHRASLASHRNRSSGSRGRFQESDKEPVKVRLWTHDQNYIDFFTHRAEELSQSPESGYAYELEITQAPSGDIVTKALAALAAGQGMPDLLGIEISEFSRFMQSGVAEATLLDLTERIAPVRDQFFESRIAPYSVDGKVYAVESAYPLSVYYYRQDIFKKYGIETPLSSWDQVMEIGQSIAVPNGQSMAAITSTGGPSGNDITHFGLLFQQRGGTFFDANGNLTLDSPEAVDVLEFLANGLKEKVILGLGDFYGGPGAAAMQQERVIGYFMPDWFLKYVLAPTAPEQQGLWRIQPLPQFSGGGFQTSVWGGTGFAVTKDSPNLEPTWKLLEYSYMTYAGQLKRWEEIQYLPTMKEVWNDPAFDTPEPFFGDQHPGPIFKQLAADAPTQYQSPYWNQMTIRLSEQIIEVFNGSKTPRQAINDAAQAIASEMA